MSGVSRGGSPQLGRVPTIIALDDDDSRRCEIQTRLSEEFGGDSVSHDTVRHDMARLLRLVDSSIETACPAFLVATSLLSAKEDVAAAMKGLPQGGKWIAYFGDQGSADEIQLAQAAGAFTCVSMSDVEAAVHGVLLANELEATESRAPVALDVLNRINVGISIQSPQMDVIWMCFASVRR